MKLTIVSDLHIDINNQSAIMDWSARDVLIVAGDTSNSANKTANFLNEMLNFYKYVVYVDGNHEHYSNNFYSQTHKTDTIENNLKYLDSLTEPGVIRLSSDKYFDYGDYRFIGCCGWYTFDYYSNDLNKSLELWQMYSNDWHQIYKKGSLKQMLPHGLAKNQSEKILEQIKSTPSDKKIIVVTHTVPHKKMLDYRPQDSFWEETSSFYYNSHNQKILEDENVMMWINGHTHLNKSMEINGTVCICNPRGYPSENPSWKPLNIDL